MENGFDKIKDVNNQPQTQQDFTVYSDSTNPFTDTLHWDDDIGRMLYSDEEIKEVNENFKSSVFTGRVLDMFSRQSELSDRVKKTFLKESFECLRKFYKERWGIPVVPYYE